MPKWEYARYDRDARAVTFSHRELVWRPAVQMRDKKIQGDEQLYALRLLGDEGWELVAIDTAYRYIFKRPLA